MKCSGTLTAIVCRDHSSRAGKRKANRARQRGSLKERTVFFFYSLQAKRESSGKRGNARFCPVCQLKATKYTISICLREVDIMLMRPTLPWIAHRGELNTSCCFFFFSFHATPPIPWPSRENQTFSGEIQTFSAQKEHDIERETASFCTSKTLKHVAYLRKPVPLCTDECYQLSECHCVS